MGEKTDSTTSGVKSQITKTLYDEPVNLNIQTAGNSRKRVVASVFLQNAVDTEGDSTLYNYDVSGNVKTLVQHVKDLVAADPNNGKKRIDYDYDLISGKVNKVTYQRGKGDQFYYKYSYDAENRVVGALSSRDGLIWTEDARYRYYLHGPLARTELGQYKVQGIDYAYTLQGWLKGINSDVLAAASDMGGDGNPSTTFSQVSRDVYSFKLGYHDSDYLAIGSSAGAFGGRSYSPPSSLQATGNQLFNGNISYTTLALSRINSGATTGYSYGYDQLNRLVEMRHHSTTGGWSNGSIITAYSESIAYDANGNILKYLRKGANTTGNPLDMDSLNYNYSRDGSGRLVHNRLDHVKDAVGSSNYTVDIDNQGTGNYIYDKIGNLNRDVAEGIDSIQWTVYGKIHKIVKGSGTTQIGYRYDAGGNRTSKRVVSGASVTNTFYVRDAQGNVLGVYSQTDNEGVNWAEQHLYGSSRLGMWRWDTLVPAQAPIVQGSMPMQDSVILGSRTYELSNHLGNVLATISDKKVGHEASGLVDYYTTEVLSQTDYYPFGMGMPDRQFSVASGYRYGFNGKENDNEVKATGNQIDFGARSYDPRIASWLSIDPLAKKYPGESPYLYTGGNPILFADPDGKDRIVTITRINKDGSYTQIRKIYKNEFFYNEQYGASGGTTYTKANIIQNLTIDLRDNSITKKTFTNNEREIEADEFHSRYLTPEIGDESKSVRFGFKIYGKGKNMEWQNGLPTAGPGSESIDLDNFLDMAAGMRDGAMSPADLATNKDVKFIYEAISKSMDMIDKSVEATQSITQSEESTENTKIKDKPFKDLKRGSPVHVRGDRPRENRTVLTDSTAQCCEIRPAKDTVPKKK